MFMISPLSITDGMVSAINVPEPGPGEMLWSGATPYKLDDIVLRLETHRLYKCLVAGQDAKTPESNPAKWFDLAPSNRWAMFDVYKNTASANPGSLTVTLAPGAKFNGLALVGVTATTVTVTQTYQGNVIFTKTDSMVSRKTARFYDFCFAPFRARAVWATFSLLPRAESTVTITLAAAGPVSLGGVILGYAEYIGKTQYEPEIRSDTLSQFKRLPDGTVEYIAGRSIPVNDQTVRIDRWRLDAIYDLLDSVVGKPCFWSGLDDLTNPYAKGLQMLGMLKSYRISLKPFGGVLSANYEEY